jgi:hypothetical protein
MDHRARLTRHALAVLRNIDLSSSISCLSLIDLGFQVAALKAVLGHTLVRFPVKLNRFFELGDWGLENY